MLLKHAITIMYGMKQVEEQTYSWLSVRIVNALLRKWLFRER